MHIDGLQESKGELFLIEPVFEQLEQVIEKDGNALRSLSLRAIPGVIDRCCHY